MNPAIRNLILGVFLLALFYFASLVIFINFASIEDCTSRVLDQKNSVDDFYIIKVENKVCKRADINMTNTVLVNLFSNQKKKIKTVFSGEVSDVNQQNNIGNEIRVKWSDRRLLEILYSRKIKPVDFQQNYNDLQIRHTGFK
ncbi:MAG: hypothetical protein OEW89_09275 [Gammaproteobacteria bacterium]|nr:hypothetical protein [Gammaproteobacteria bacterium]